MEYVPQKAFKIFAEQKIVGIYFLVNMTYNVQKFGVSKNINEIDAFRPICNLCHRKFLRCLQNILPI